MSRDAGLMDPGALDDVTDLPFAVPKGLDDPTARRIGEGLEDIELHASAYALPCI